MAKANFFPEKKKKTQTKTPDARTRTPPVSPHPRLPCPARLLGQGPQPRASLRLKVQANSVSNPQDTQANRTPGSAKAREGV